MVPALLTALLLGASPPPCGVIGLEEALALALERSDEVAIRESEVAAARADQALATAARIIPSATVTMLTGPSPEARIAPDGKWYDSPSSNREFVGIRPFGRVDVSIVQPLYTWGRLDAARDAAEAGVAAREQLVRDMQAQVQVRVYQLYWGTALARRLLVLANDIEGALNQADEKLTELLKEGESDVSQADRFRLDVFRGVVRARKAEAQKGLDMAQIGLAATIGLAPSKLTVREEPLPTVPGEVPDPAEVLAAAERQRPDLKALDDAIRAREAEVKAARGARLPQFFVAGTFAYSYAPNRDIVTNPWVGDFFNTLAIGGALGLRQDLSFPMLNARLEKAEAERDTLVRQRAGLARLVQVQVDSALAEVRAARERTTATTAALGSGKSLFRSVGLDFSAGLTDAKTLIEAYGVYVESQVTAAQASYDLIVARARLAQATGEAPRKGNRCEVQ